MFIINNQTPFNVSVSIIGKCRLFPAVGETSDTVVDNIPYFSQWPIEWINILMYGPIYKNISFTILPWDTVTHYINSCCPPTITFGFSDKSTVWAKHSPGTYECSSCNVEVTVTCNPGQPIIKRQRNGPSTAHPIPLNIKMESTDSTWNEVVAPITTVQYTPTFNHAYYKKR